jgi:hypothetical protein
MLRENGIYTRVVSVIDGNCIDKEVHKFKPNIVVLEAIWCPPYKLKELAKLWPGIRWIVRIHSEIPFLANEGMAIAWLFEYSKIPNVQVAANSLRAFKDLEELSPLYLPNYYSIHCQKAYKLPSDELNIGCFGAVRPLKNQLAQAFAAIKYAQHERKPLNFYINSTRTEQGGDQPLKNIRSLFANQPPEFKLVEAPWLGRLAFLELLRTMDACMSVSFTETFCITAANAASQGVPIVTSSEVPWSFEEIQASPTNITEIFHKLEIALGHKKDEIVHKNLEGLRRYDEISVVEWLELGS